MDDSQQEATEKEVERILGYLKSYYQDDREFKVSLEDVDIFLMVSLLSAYMCLFLPQQQHQYRITSLSLTPTRFPGQ